MKNNGIKEASQIAESKWTEAANILSGLNINPIAISESAFSQTEELIYQVNNSRLKLRACGNKQPALEMDY